MIKLQELLGIKKMVYSESIKPKHKKKMSMSVKHFHEDISLPYSLGFTHKPDNDSKNTLKELNYLSKLKTDEDLVKESLLKENATPSKLVNLLSVLKFSFENSTI